MTTTDIHRTIEAVWRIESAKLIAALARMVHDIGLAEELAQDALVAALERWPETGVPDNPAAWLMTTAKRRAIDRLRRSKLQWSKHAEIARELEEQQDMRSEEHTSELQSLMRISYAVFCLKKKKNRTSTERITITRTYTTCKHESLLQPTTVQNNTRD